MCLEDLYLEQLFSIKLLIKKKKKEKKTEDGIYLKRGKHGKLESGNWSLWSMVLYTQDEMVIGRYQTLKEFESNFK